GNQPRPHARHRRRELSHPTSHHVPSSRVGRHRRRGTPTAVVAAGSAGGQRGGGRGCRGGRVGVAPRRRGVPGAVRPLVRLDRHRRGAGSAQRDAPAPARDHVDRLVTGSGDRGRPGSGARRGDGHVVVGRRHRQDPRPLPASRPVRGAHTGRHPRRGTGPEDDAHPGGLRQRVADPDQHRVRCPRGPPAVPRHRPGGRAVSVPGGAAGDRSRGATGRGDRHPRLRRDRARGHDRHRADHRHGRAGRPHPDRASGRPVRGRLRGHPPWWIDRPPHQHRRSRAGAAGVVLECRAQEAAIMSTARAAVAASAERLLGWLAFVGAVAAWQVVATMGEARSVASFGDSARALVDILWGPDLADHVLPSLGRVVAGFGVTALVGIGFGLLLGTFHGIEPWVRPVIEFLRAVPPPLIVPVAMMIMGLSGNVVITVIVFGTLWPVLINTLDGASRVEPLYLDTARVFRSPRWVVLRSVVLPASLPTIMAGLRTALSISLIMLVLGEMLASSTGIGYLILTSQQTFDVPATYGGVLLLGLLGWTFDTLFVVIERRVLRWNSEFSGGSDV